MTAGHVTDLDQLQRVASNAVLDAGRLLLDSYSHEFWTTTKSSPSDLVTEIDHRSEHLIKASLLRDRPMDGLLSEEGTNIASKSGVRWICDPIDGTANFVRRRHPFVVSLAAQVDGQTKVAAVFDPLLDELFEATDGAGAFLNGERITCQTDRPLAQCVVATALGRDSMERRRQALFLSNVVSRVADIRRSGAAVYDICSVAANRCEAYFFEKLKIWDMAAAGLIAREAGAVVGSLLDDRWESGRFALVAAPSIAYELRSLFQSILDEPGSEEL